MTDPTKPRSPAGAIAPYALAVFLSSSFLFFIEPIAGKRVLPLLGGSAAVWTACLVFFQLALLLGYFLAHWLTSRVATRTQGRIYIALLVLSIVQLFVALHLNVAADTNHPVRSVLWFLTLMIGLPFVTLSISSPLLQAWFARSRSVAESGGASHAYRLYAVSNIGSLLALVVYPWLIEPRASLREQIGMTIAGVVVLTLVCGAIVLFGAQIDDTGPAESPSRVADSTTPLATTLLWIALACCGSVLLCAVTNHISQNVATIPLLWIVPLIAYLLSFVVAFSDERWHPRPIVAALGATGLALATYRLYHGDLHMSVPVTVALYCGSLFAVCLFCHGELYHRRPAPAHLTRFYFCLAAGGALGAILVGVVAPVTLSGNYELLLGLCFAAMLGVVTLWDLGSVRAIAWLPPVAWMIGAGIIAWVLHRDVDADKTNAVLRVRNFYGTLHVTQDSDAHYEAWTRTLYHGIIEHGQQVYRADLDTTPTTYYGRSTGVGLAVTLCCGDGPRRIGVIGLGTGTMAAYGRSGDVVRFYDINPAVPPIAQHYFTYWSKSRAKVDVVLGDARVSLAHETPQNYDVLAIDAFSGDAIPVHLITSEALDLYKRHLSANGVVAFHVSNRYLNLAPVVKQLAAHAGMHAIFISSGDDTTHDVFSSDWVLVTNNQALIDALAYSKDREDIAVPPGLRRWTDDYNSLLPILRTRKTD